ncbi:ECF-type sigma factor [Parasphingopyxis sp.]|uniref:ECF-type sigma factor n=1 Tax=Parasphingopyxis sp. TaxID=1920299 RepID=UPI00263690BB|nr:ECF-type sigma factor [Parasphingopyxis sp.]
MGEEADAPATQLLRQWRNGDEDAQEALIRLFYPRLQKKAAGLLAHENQISLAPGDLVHESIIRIINSEQLDWQDRAHFLALSSRLMRRVLIDHIRAKNADKRRHRRVTLMTGLHNGQRMDLQALHHALLRLSAIDRENADIVEMRFFGGMSIADVATVTGLSEPTVKRRWAAARVWLADALGNGNVG